MKTCDESLKSPWTNQQPTIKKNYYSQKHNLILILLLQNPNILTALRPRHGENIAEKSITVCSGLDMVNINLTHFVFANKEDADVSIKGRGPLIVNFLN